MSPYAAGRRYVGFAPRHAYTNLCVVKDDMFKELTAATRPKPGGLTVLSEMLHANGGDTNDVLTSLTDIV